MYMILYQRGGGCPFCNGAKPSRYNEEWVRANTPSPYRYIERCESMSTKKCKFHCDVCGIDFFQFPSRLINKHIYGCDC